MTGRSLASLGYASEQAHFVCACPLTSLPKGHKFGEPERLRDLCLAGLVLKQGGDLRATKRGDFDNSPRR